MKKGLTELAFILDRSGSMSGLESDTIGGYNALLEKQKEEPGSCTLTTVLFDDKYELLHDRIDLRGAEPLSSREYFVRGSTALLDAIGRTVSEIGNAQKYTAKGERAEKVIVVIITDGMENASQEYDYQMVQQMIERQKKHYGWEFIFLGANIDAVRVAARFGIASNRAANYHADSEGTQLNYEVISETVSGLRSSHTVGANWKERIDADYQMRGR